MRIVTGGCLVSWDFSFAKPRQLFPRGKSGVKVMSYHQFKNKKNIKKKDKHQVFHIIKRLKLSNFNKEIKATI